MTFKPGQSGNPAGKAKGTASKRTREIADRAAAEGITPLEYMLKVLRDESNDTDVRMDAAKSAAPYIHPRLSAIEADVKGKLDIRGWLMSAAGESGSAED